MTTHAHDSDKRAIEILYYARINADNNLTVILMSNSLPYLAITAAFFIRAYRVFLADKSVFKRQNARMIYSGGRRNATRGLLYNQCFI